MFMSDKPVGSGAKILIFGRVSGHRFSLNALQDFTLRRQPQDMSKDMTPIFRDKRKCTFGTERLAKSESRQEPTSGHTGEEKSDI